MFGICMFVFRVRKFAIKGRDDVCSGVQCYSSRVLTAYSRNILAVVVVIPLYLILRPAPFLQGVGVVERIKYEAVKHNKRFNFLR
jgi:hypothetical protein